MTEMTETMSTPTWEDFAIKGPVVIAREAAWASAFAHLTPQGALRAITRFIEDSFEYVNGEKVELSRELEELAEAPAGTDAAAAIPPMVSSLMLPVMTASFMKASRGSIGRQAWKEAEIGPGMKGLTDELLFPEGEGFWTTAGTGHRHVNLLLEAKLTFKPQLFNFVGVPPYAVPTQALQVLEKWM